MSLQETSRSKTDVPKRYWSGVPQGEEQHMDFMDVNDVFINIYEAKDIFVRESLFSCLKLV